jgi:hypothetical protein
VIDVAVRGRLRPAYALAVVAGMLLALYSLCCCLEGEQPSSADYAQAAVTVQVVSARYLAVDGDGHADQYCDHPVSAVAAVPVPVFSAAAIVTAAAADQAEPTSGAARGVVLATPRPPVAHLLCVMRT